MSRATTIAAIKAIPHMTARWEDFAGEYRVTYSDWSKDRAEAVACYTDDPEDAIGTAEAMSKAWTGRE